LYIAALSAFFDRRADACRCKKSRYDQNIRMRENSKMNTKQIEKSLVRLLSCAFVLISAWGYAADKYTIKDLRQLHEQGHYFEIIDHMNDIHPTNRTQAWTRIVNHAVTKALENQMATTDAYSALLWSQQMLESIPALKESQEFINQYHKVVISGSALCYQNSYDGVECTERLQQIIQGDLSNKTLAFKAGKLVRLNMNSASAIPFFIQALRGAPDTKACSDPDVLLAIKAGMGRSGKIAEGARELGFSLCFNTLKDELLQDFYNSHGSALANYCKALSEKNMLTKFQKAHCSDQ
jgi:hypothetical protein